MNLQDVYELMNHFEQSGMTEIEVELEGARIVCKKESGCGNKAVLVNETVNKAEGNNYVVTKANSSETVVSSEQTGDKPNSEAPAAGVEVRAKVAGTFYRAPSPESEPFVQVGQTVKKGDTIGMIEAMKMMNDIAAPVDGEIQEIVVGNEELVGYDDVLVIIKEL
ncbi:MAG: acetyl-CoA carboxylase biotin carboxyl carrier protein [Lachnospiraceae bacterium]|nr:acetyl-CoA carboxylase biotin carboxyl carrier protein [Lachnospiraceae bacterium]